MKLSADERPAEAGEDLEAAYREILARSPKVFASPEMLAQAANPMEAWFYGHHGRRTGKWAHYLEVYDHYLSRFRDRPVRLLEIGVSHGGSLQVWKRYLGPQAQVHGLDINPQVAAIDDEDLKVHIGDQSDPGVLDRILAETGGFEVVIDDGGHVGADQIASFEHLFPRLADGGVYICEDLHAAYWRFHGGGLGRSGTFIEYIKGLLDALHSRYFEAGEGREVAPWLRHVHAVSVYDSIAVIEKRTPRDPFRFIVGRQKLIAPSTPVTKPVRPV